MIDIEQAMLELQKKEAFLKAKKDTVDSDLAMNRKLFQDTQSAIDLYTQCTQLLVDTSLAIQEKTTKKIADIVTALYREVFQSNDEFVIQVDAKRKTPVANFFIKTQKGGHTLYLDPVESDGGGKLDVIALGLRLAALLLYRPALRKVLILDEPMRFISSDKTSEFPFRYRAVAFLKKIAQEYGIQVISVTHDSELVDLADKHYEFSLDGEGYTRVK